jgi:hypothetical protein
MMEVKKNSVTHHLTGQKVASLRQSHAQRTNDRVRIAREENSVQTGFYTRILSSTITAQIYSDLQYLQQK